MAKKENNVGDFLEKIYPKYGKIGIDEDGNLYTIIVDAESDGFMCNFNHDNCVQIDTNGYSYITLDRNTLLQLAKLIQKAEKIYDRSKTRFYY